MKLKQDVQKKKRAYHPPKLMDYGQLQELTTGGSGINQEKGGGDPNKRP